MLTGDGAAEIEAELHDLLERGVSATLLVHGLGSVAGGVEHGGVHVAVAEVAGRRDAYAVLLAERPHAVDEFAGASQRHADVVDEVAAHRLERVADEAPRSGELQ